MQSAIRNIFAPLRIQEGKQNTTEVHEASQSYGMTRSDINKVIKDNTFKHIFTHDHFFLKY